MQRYGVLVRGGCLWDFPTIVLWLHEIRKWKMLSLFLLGWSCSPSHITCPFSTPPQATPLYPTYSHLTGKKLFLLKCPFFTARMMNIWIWSNACTLEIPKGIEDGGKGGGGRYCCPSQHFLTFFCPFHFQQQSNKSLLICQEKRHWNRTSFHCDLLWQ